MALARKEIYVLVENKKLQTHVNTFYIRGQDLVLIVVKAQMKLGISTGHEEGNSNHRRASLN